MDMTNSLSLICTKYLLSEFVFVETLYRNNTIYSMIINASVRYLGNQFGAFRSPNFSWCLYMGILMTINCKMVIIFQAGGFDLSKTFESLSNEGIYPILQGNHYSPILVVNFNLDYPKTWPMVNFGL